jgi:hypothetical protein
MILRAGNESRNMLAPDKVFRPTHIRVAVEEPGVASIERIIFGNVDQLICAVDCWNWSIKLAQQMRDDFLTEHKLVGKSAEEIDRYLDRNGYSIPDPGRIMLPTVSPRENITIVGNFKEDTRLFFFGLTN